MKNTYLLLSPVASALLLLTASVARADDPDAAIVLGDVVVTSDRGGPVLPDRLLTSVDILGANRIRDRQVAQSWELLGQLPGIQLTETRIGAESGKATFRAFNGEGYINGIKTLIDGIPSNVNSGNQRFIDMLFPLEIDYIEVVRGTNDPRYGLHNIGGNLNFGTRQGGNYNEGRLTYGSFATREVQAAVGREDGQFAQNYFVGRQDSNGYRQHDASHKSTAAGKWFVRSADNTVRVGLTLRTYSQRAQAPGFLTADEYAANRRQSPLRNGNDGDDREMQQGSLQLDWQINADTFTSHRLYVNRYEDDRLVTFTGNPIGTAPRQRRRWDEHQTGWLGTLTWRGLPQWTIDAGMNVERQDNRYRRDRYPFATPTDFSTPTFIQNDDQYTFNNVGAYLQAIYQPIDWLKIVPGYRTDRFTGQTRLEQTGVTAGLQDSGWIHQPKLSVVVSPRPHLNLYANWGRTFQVLTGSRAPAYLTPGQPAFRPSINTGKELGVKFKPATGVDMRVAVWRQDATDEVANMPSTGTTVGLGRTRRQGLDLQVSGRLTQDLSLWYSHSLQKAEVVSAFTTAGTSLAGREVFHTPRYIINVGADYRVSDAVRVGLQGRAQGKHYIDELNTQGRYGGFVLFDASLRYTLSRTASVDLLVRNLADRRYAYVWYDNFFHPVGSEQPSFAPGPGRAAYVSLNLSI